MAAIRGGEFKLGDPDRPVVLPVHNATLGDFCIDKFEVTVAEFRAFGGRIAAEDYCPTEPKFPVRCIFPDDARAYCRAHGKHLVTSDEWEAAAGGHQRRRNPWGDSPPSTIDMGHLHPVGANPVDVTPEEVFDLGGNVAEFTESDVCTHYLTRGPAWVLVRGGGGLANGDPLTYEARCTAPTNDSSGFRCAQ